MYLILSLWIVGWNILSMAKNIDKFCHIENTLPGRKHHKKDGEKIMAWGKMKYTSQK